MIYDREGNFLDSWGEGIFSYRTHGMFMDGEDRLFLVDDDGNSVTRHALDGTLLQTIGPRGVKSDTGYDRSTSNLEVKYGGPPYNRPTNVAVAPNGEIFVSDGYGNSRIHRFSHEGELQQSWGEPGTGPGELHTPHSVWVLPDGRLIVCDRQNERLQILDADGNYLTEWTDVQRPQDVFVDKDGLVYVAELSWKAGDYSYSRGEIDSYVAARVSILDSAGNVLLRWADPDPTKDGYFIAPHGIWVDDQGSIYLAEVTHTIAVRRGLAPPDAHTIQKFARI
jgi:sugar lactone lactonase YvrE